MKTKEQNKEIAHDLVKWLNTQPPIQDTIDKIYKSSTIMKQRFLTDKQVMQMEQDLERLTENIKYCSAISNAGDYIELESVFVHRRELQNIPYRECGKQFEVLYMDKFRLTSKLLFTIHN